MLALSEIPTAYRLPFYRHLAEQPGIDLTVLFCADAEPDRPWKLDGELRGVRHRVLPGVQPRIRTRKGTFVYEINPTILHALREERYDVLVLGGYSVLATQVAIVYARARGIPYILHSESTLLKPRSALKRAAKRALVSSVVRSAAAGLAAGSAAAEYLAAYGLPRDRIRICPNTIDVAEYGGKARAARERATDVRRARGLPDRYVLFAGRLVEDKGIGDLLAAQRMLGDRALPLVVAGTGPLEHALDGARHVGFVQRDELIELYALAEWTVVPSRVEPWGVVVNEALACGSPVIATEAVGAARDLVVDGVNGRIVRASDPAALAGALSGPRPSGDPSRGAIEQWDYEFAVEQFLEAVRLAL